MIGRNLKRVLEERVAPHEAPVLSLYLAVNPANPSNTPKAYVIRATEALRRMGLGSEYVAEVGKRLTLDFAIPQGRSLVIFAGEDPHEFFEGHFLQTRLPLLEETDGVLAHMGRPFIAPLLYVLDQRERHAVIYVSEDRVRVFEAFLGQMQEISDHVREVDTDSWQPYKEARRSPGVGKGVAGRGGTGVDAFRDRMREASARLYRELLPELERSLQAEEVDRIILSGTPAALSAFQGQMGDGLLRRIVGQVPPPPNPDASAQEWLPAVKEVVDEVEAKRELALLDRIRESGVAGVQETLTLLQQRRLHTLVVPWVPDKRIFRSANGRFAASAEELEVLDPGAETREVPLLEALPELVADTGTVLEFMEGEAQERLIKEFGSLAGLQHY